MFIKRGDAQPILSIIDSSDPSLKDKDDAKKVLKKTVEEIKEKQNSNEGK